jgi:molybdopterin molybdotransferase
MLELEDAQERILSAVQPLGEETVPLSSAAGRVLRQSVVSPIDLPPFDNSAMDGYAVRAADVAAACELRPVSLEARGQIPAGEVFAGIVESGTCVRLFTGSPLPEGADTVVMQEDTRVNTANPGEVRFIDAVRPWENVRLRGEDVKCGTVLVQGGDRLTAGRLALLAAAGVEDVRVGRRPTTGVLATGSELIESGQSLRPGTIYESNRVMLAAQAQRDGVIARVFPLVRDTPSAACEALRAALNECDVLVTSGGVSVGEFDFVKQAIQSLGGELDFWRVSIKPGKPFVFGRAHGKLLFGLPGNPVSALVTFLLLARPALLRLQGARDTGLPKSSGLLTETLSNPGNRRHFMRVAVDDAGRVRSAGAQASHILSSLAGANGLVDVPPNASLSAGTMVPVLRWD